MNWKLAEKEINVLGIKKENNELYVFLYDDGNKAKIIEVFRRFASNPELSFTSYDAYRLTCRINRRRSYRRKRFR